MIVAMLLGFIVLIFLGVPITFSTGIAAAVYLLAGGDIPPMVVCQRMYTSSASFAMLAVPLFMIAGELMNKAGITKAIVRLSSALIGHIRGSLAHVTILSSALFAGMSGSSVAAASSVGGMMIPCAATMGPIIPPSIAFIIYASITGDSVGKLFLGGVMPGILMAICLMTIAYVVSVKKKYPIHERSTWGERGRAFVGSIGALMMPVIIMGGILSGIFTSTEAGAVGLAYGLCYGLVTKSMKLKDLPGVIYNGALTSAAVMFIIATSQALAWLLTVGRVPQLLVNFMTGLTDDPTVIILIVLLVLLIMGCFLVDAAMITIMTPLFIPIVKAYGIDPIQFGVVMVMMTTTGGITPPVGSLLFVASGTANVPIMKTAKAMIPFAAALIFAMVLCACVPQIVTFLPNLVMS